MLRTDVDLQIAGTTDVSNDTCFSHFYLAIFFYKCRWICVILEIRDVVCLCQQAALMNLHYPLN